MPFQQRVIPKVSPDDVFQIRMDIAKLWGCDGRYLEQLTSEERGAFDRLIKYGLAELDPQSNLDAKLGHGKVRVNDEVNVVVDYEDPLCAEL